MMMESAGEEAEKYNSIALPCSAVKMLVHKYESNMVAGPANDLRIRAGKDATAAAEKSSTAAMAEMLAEQHEMLKQVVRKMDQLEAQASKQGSMLENLHDHIMGTEVNRNLRQQAQMMETKTQIEKMVGTHASQTRDGSLEIEPWADLDAMGAAIIAGTPVKCVVVKWFADQGYGFVRAANVEIFCHARSLRGAEALRQGEHIMAKVITDESVKANGYRTKMAWTAAAWPHTSHDRRASSRSTGHRRGSA